MGKIAKRCVNVRMGHHVISERERVTALQDGWDKSAT